MSDELKFKIQKTSFFTYTHKQNHLHSGKTYSYRAPKKTLFICLSPPKKSTFIGMMGLPRVISTIKKAEFSTGVLEKNEKMWTGGVKRRPSLELYI